MIEDRYKKHTLKLKLDDHPEYIIEKIKNLEKKQFGYDAFGLKDNIKRSSIDYLKNYKNYLTL